MAAINFGSAVSLKEAAQLILHVPENRFFLEGEPGCGKSSLLAALAEQLPNHSIGYIDCASMDLGDTAMPAVDVTNMVTHYAPSSRFQLHKTDNDGKPVPVCIMIDEFTKAPVPVQNMLHPLLEVSNPRLGDIPLPEGSIVFLTGNMSSDGVGDTLKAHSRNRLSVVQVRKPSDEQWLEWAITSEKIDPVIMAWVKQFPHAMASYMEDGQADNPYIYNPKKMMKAYVSPRSLERVSNIVKKRANFTSESLIAAMSGTVGESAARDMQAFIEYQDQLPAWEAIIKEPKKTRIPDSAGACAVLIYGAIAKIDKATIDPFMQYLSRFEPEWQATFAVNVVKNSTKQALAFTSLEFRTWLSANEDLL